MKILFCALLLFVSFVSVFSQDAKQSVEALRWISGCWEMKSNGRVTTERWAPPTENLMLGTSQSVKGGRSVAFEFLRVVNSGTGLAYVAKPSGAKDETVFPIKSMTDTEVVFENLKHDFPQRVMYTLEGPNSLNARIEGMMAGKLKGIDFPMKKTSCS